MSKEYTAFNGDAFWNDDYVLGLDMAETAVYFHYITSPRLENSGVFKEGQRMVSFYVKTDIDTVKKADEKLEKDGKIYRIGEWVIVPSSLKHQKFDRSPNMIKGIYEQLKTAPVEVLKMLQQCGYILDLSPVVSPTESETPNPSATLPEPLPNPSETDPLYSDQDKDSDQDQDQEKHLPENAENIDVETPKKLFLHIWQHTPDVFNSTAKIESPKDFDRFWETSNTTYDQVKIGLNNFILDVRSGAIEPRFVPTMPDRFVLKGWILKCQKRFKHESKTAPPPSTTPSRPGKKSL